MVRHDWLQVGVQARVIAPVRFFLLLISPDFPDFHLIGLSFLGFQMTGFTGGGGEKKRRKEKVGRGEGKKGRVKRGKRNGKKRRKRRKRKGKKEEKHRGEE